MLKSATFDACVCSPLNRARRTAEIVWGSRAGPLTVLPELREVRPPARLSWEGKGGGRPGASRLAACLETSIVLNVSPPLRPAPLPQIDLYSFQGLIKDEGMGRYGEAWAAWKRDGGGAEFQLDGHYPVRELWDRALECWEVRAARAPVCAHACARLS